MIQNREKIHRYIYLFGLTSLGIMLCWSVFLMSATQFLLLGNWILEGNFKQKISILKKRKSILVFTGIILVHFLWLFNTNNIQYALHDIQIKIPLLILPIIIGTSKLLTKKELNIILIFFVASIFFASLFSIAIYLGFTKFEYVGYRSLSVFVSHIRFSLMLVMAMVISGYFALKNNNIQFKILYFSLALWFLFFVFFLQSITGVIVVIFILFIGSFNLLFLFKNVWIKTVLLISILLLVYIIFNWGKQSINKFYYVNKTDDITKLDKFTINNNIYLNDTSNNITENGNLVTIYISNYELKKEWNKRSSLFFDSLDNKGNLIKYTLYRYLASKNLRKDSVGISKLTDNDIKNIENGMPNYLFENKISPYIILYKLLSEYETYKNTQNINNKSTLQRVEYFRTGVQIFNNNLFLGIGTGDVQDKFNEYYNKNNSTLTEENRHRAHNQILTFLITFGLFGFLIILFAFIYPLFYETNKNNILLSYFLMIIILSFLNEDTLETQAGVTFAGFFYMLFVFGYKK